MNYRLLISVVSISLLAGCTSMRQKSNFESFDSKLNVGDYQAAAEVALDKSGYDPKTGEVDDLLWSIQAGASLQSAGNYELSTKVLDISEKLMKSEDTESIIAKSGETIGSMMGNDAMLDYEQTQYDGVMANTIKAWNFIQTHEYSDARVEFNRAEERQRRAAQHFASIIEKRKKEIKDQSKDQSKENFKLIDRSIKSDSTKKALAKVGIKTNNWTPYEGYVNPFTTYSYGLNLLLTGHTKSDYQKAADAFKRVYSLSHSTQAANDLKIARRAAKGNTKSINNQVWVIFENGLSIVKEEKRLDLPVFLVNGNVAYIGIALPALKERGKALSSISINGHQTQTISNMDKIIKSEFDKEFPYILAREITRTVIKTIAQKQIKDKNPLVGNIFAAVQALTTGADIRTFSALPSEYQAMSFKKTSNTVELKAGQFTIPIQLDSSASNQIIYIKSVSANIAPTIHVTNI